MPENNGQAINQLSKALIVKTLIISEADEVTIEIPSLKNTETKEDYGDFTIVIKKSF